MLNIVHFPVTRMSTMSQGGILMYIRESIESVRCDDLSNGHECEFELHFVKIRHGK